MKIDLNDPAQFTLDNVKKLIASKDDSDFRQLRVSKAGIAYLSDEIGNENISGLAFRCVTFDPRRGYVGEVASQDEEWIYRVFSVLKKNWPSPEDDYIEII